MTARTPQTRTLDRQVIYTTRQWIMDLMVEIHLSTYYINNSTRNVNFSHFQLCYIENNDYISYFSCFIKMDQNTLFWSVLWTPPWYNNKFTIQNILFPGLLSKQTNAKICSVIHAHPVPFRRASLAWSSKHDKAAGRGLSLSVSSPYWITKVVSTCCGNHFTPLKGHYHSHLTYLL